MFKKHQHDFKESTNKAILYCHCGKVEKIPCNHEWKVHSEQNIKKNVLGGEAEQILQIVICTRCGELRFINLITGEIEREKEPC